MLGRSGQVARALAEQTGWRCLGRPEVDLFRVGAAAHAIARARPGFVVNAAGFTAVDAAEAQPALAHRINAEAVKEIAVAAEEVGAALLHVSTDYVFDGSRSGLYDEEVPPAPLSVYGRSKLEGEEAARAANPRTVILRTAWVYAPWGGNFVRTMLRLGAERQRVRVVDDQHGTPTSALDLARACRRVVAALEDAPPDDPRWGIYHYAGSGTITWAGFARAIFARAERGAEVQAISTAEFPTPARRPANSALDTVRFAETFGLAPRPWSEALDEVMARIEEVP